MRREKRRGVKCFMAMCLTVIMTLGMCLTATAAINPGDKGSITVNGIETGSTGNLKAYKVIDVHFDTGTLQQPQEPVYTWVSAVRNWVGSYTPTGGTAGDYIVSGSDGEVSDTFKNLKDDSLVKEFVDALAKAINNGTVKLTSVGEQGITSTAVTYNNLDMGAYLFIVNDGVKIYSPAFAKVYPTYNNGWSLSGDTIDVSVKGTDPTITKTVDGDKTVQVGDIVTYKLQIDVPQYPTNAIDKYFAFGDTMSEGLTFNNDVKIGKSQGADDLKSYFDNTSSTATGKTFEYRVKNYDNFKQALGGETKIYVEYTAKVNAKAVENKDNLKNKAHLEYSNSPYEDNKHNTKEDEEQIYTYKLKVTKDDLKEDNADLSGVKFELYKGSKNSGIKVNLVRESEGVYHVAADGETSTTTELGVHPTDFTLLIKGLDAATYVLSEVKAPAGYPLPANPDVEVVLGDTAPADGALDSVGATGAIVPTADPIVVDSVDLAQANLTILNSLANFSLPITGGMGTAIFTICGILLMGGAILLVAMLARKRR